MWEVYDSWWASTVPYAFEKVPPKPAPRDNLEHAKRERKKTRTRMNGYGILGVICKVLERDLLEIRYSP